MVLGPPFNATPSEARYTIEPLRLRELLLVANGVALVATVEACEPCEVLLLWVWLGCLGRGRPAL